MGRRAVKHPDGRLAEETVRATLTQVRETARFLEAGSRSRMLAAEAARVMPDGITRETIRRQPYAPAVASAHGSVLVDVDGDERTDLLYNHTALIHGHGYPPMPPMLTTCTRSDMLRSVAELREPTTGIKPISLGPRQIGSTFS